MKLHTLSRTFANHSIRAAKVAFCTMAFALLAPGSFAQTWHTIGTGTDTNGPNGVPAPFGDIYAGQRAQYIYLASELTSAGIAAGDEIVSIRWVVTAVNGSDIHDNYTIHVGNTSASSLSGLLSTPTGASTVPVDYQPVMGPNDFNLKNGFVWNGTSNLLVEVIHFSTAFGAYSANASVAFTSTAPVKRSFSLLDDWLYKADQTAPVTAQSGETLNSTGLPNIVLGVGSSCPPLIATGYDLPINTTMPTGAGLSIDGCASGLGGNFTATHQFPGSNFAFSGTAWTTRASLNIPALPAGAQITNARLILTNIVAGGQTPTANLQVNLQGQITGAFSVAPNFTGINGTIPELILQMSGDAPEGIVTLQTRKNPNTSGTCYLGSVRIEIDYMLPTPHWYTAASGGDPIAWGTQTLDPVAMGLVDPSEEGSTTFHVSCGMPANPCLDQGRTPVNFTVSAQAGPCTGDQVVVAIRTDDNGEEITWELLDNGQNIITTGGPYTGQNNTLVADTICLNTSPVSACYGFRLMDSFGDGLNGAGYWQLRSTDGKLLLGGDFADGTNSPSITPLNPNYTQHKFCLPAGPANIAPTECGIFNNLMGNKVYANKVPGAVNYQFEFSDPDAGFIRRIARPYNYVHFWDMVTSPLIPGVKYFARVRTDRDGPMAAAHFGSGCEMGLGQVVICTQLIQAPAYGHSCNELRTFNTNGSFIYAKPVQGATEYQFRIHNSGEGYDQVFTRSTYILQLKWYDVQPLIEGNTYNVEINVKVNGAYSGFCTSTCNITIVGSGNRPEASMVQTMSTASMWPNPVSDGQVNLNIDGLVDAEQNITVDIQDVYGKQVFAKEFGNSGERFNTILNLNSEIASGVYMVNITVNGERTVQRLSIIR